MTYQAACAQADAERFQYEVNGYSTAIVEQPRVLLLIADDTGETLARFPYED